MGQRMQAAAGCLVTIAGAGAGLATWWFARVPGRWYQFEQGPNWSLIYAELPLFVIGGTVAGLAVWAVADRLPAREPQD
jgi:hypothetical protein